MVDFARRARNSGDIGADEEVLAAANVTASPFVVANAGMTGGLIAGGVVGMAAGAAWDARRRKKDGVPGEGKPLPDLAARTPFEPGIPANGALFAATTGRLITWKISAMGKPRSVLWSAALGDIDEVVWEDADTKWAAGRPRSTLLWVGVEPERVVSMAAISMGPAGKHVAALVEALEGRLGSRVSRFEG